MLIEGKKTFKDFTESEEAIATNILSAKLKLLEEAGILTKNKLPNNKKTNLYLLPLTVCITNCTNRSTYDPAGVG